MPSPTEGKPALHLLEIWAFFKVVLNASYFLNGRFLFLRHLHSEKMSGKIRTHKLSITSLLS